MPQLDTFIYWCDACGKRFGCEATEASQGEAGSIFCSDCSTAKRTRRASGQASSQTTVRSRASQIGVPPARPSSERLRPTPHGGTSARAAHPPQPTARKPAMLIGFIAAAVVTMVVVLIFALSGSKPPAVAQKKPAEPPAKTGGQITLPPTNDATLPVVNGSAPVEVAKPPVSAMDAERLARTAFDDLEAKLKALPETDRDARLALCEAFLKDHGTTILAARVSTLANNLRGPAAAPPPGRSLNLARGKPVKTSIPHESTFRPEGAVDGNTNREAAWFGKAWPSWLEVDLQQPQRIANVTVYLYPDGKRYYQYTVEASVDGKDYRQLADMSTNTALATPEGVKHAFEPVVARYVRVSILKNTANPSVHLVEVMVEPALARPVAAGTAVVHLGVMDFEGGKFYSNFMRKGTDGRAIWGLRTDTHTMKATLKLGDVPAGNLAMEIRSLRNDPPKPPATIRISINGSVVHEGQGKNTSTEWKTCSYDLPEGLLKAGENRLEIVCTEDSNVKNRAPWFMLNELKLVASSAAPRLPDVHLSDLKPVKSTCGHTGVQYDKCCWEGDALRLWGVEYAKGLGVHSVSEMVYDLAPGHKRFIARLGFHDRTDQRGKGSVVGRVAIDGTIMQETPVFRGGDPDRDFDVPIPPGSKQIALVITDGGDGEGWDLVDWVNVGFVNE